MSLLRIVTAGESHGPAETCIIEGVPANLALTAAMIDRDLERRQRGYGRGARQAIERDVCHLTAGVRLGMTLGSPICIVVENRDHANWTGIMSPEPQGDEPAPAANPDDVPRPGHADLAGVAKYGHSEIRSVLERASARETVARVAGGAVCKRILEEVGVSVRSRVVTIGSVLCATTRELDRPEQVDWDAVETSPVGCADARATEEMCDAIDRARQEGESLGGVFEVWCWGVCPGIGGYVQAADRLDGRLLGAVGSIPAVKGGEIGHAFENAGLTGSHVHDGLKVREEQGRRWIARETNRAAGIEGGMSNGMPIVVRAAMKPIPTLTSPLASVRLGVLEPTVAPVERSDVTAVPAARVVAEAMVAYVMAGSYLKKFGADSMDQLTLAVAAYERGLEERGLWRRS